MDKDIHLLNIEWRGMDFSFKKYKYCRPSSGKRDWKDKNNIFLIDTDMIDWNENRMVFIEFIFFDPSLSSKNI